VIGLPGPIRFVCMLILMTGIIAMHAFTAAGAQHSAPPGVVTGAAHHHTVITSQSTSQGNGSDSAGPDRDCGDLHTAFHACVFIMTATMVMLALAVLYWIGIGGNQHALSTLRHTSPGRERAPPPWTVLSLPELSMLRI
jgi:hypothetical protein